MNSNAVTTVKYCSIMVLTIITAITLSILLYTTYKPSVPILTIIILICVFSCLSECICWATQLGKNYEIASRLAQTSVPTQFPVQAPTYIPTRCPRPTEEFMMTTDDKYITINPNDRCATCLRRLRRETICYMECSLHGKHVYHQTCLSTSNERCTEHSKIPEDQDIIVNINPRDRCVICLRGLRHETMSYVECSLQGKHIFHQACLQKFKEENPDKDCVICR